MHLAKFLSLAPICVLMACQAKITQPINRQLVRIAGTSSEIVCKVRQIARDEKLSFHYGTADKSIGTMNTFRLIGEGYEITMVNDLQLEEYDLRLYANSGQQSPEYVIAQEKFSAVRQFVIGPTPKGCLAE